jgi:hypothetical protein
MTLVVQKKVARSTVARAFVLAFRVLSSRLIIAEEGNNIDKLETEMRRRK